MSAVPRLRLKGGRRGAEAGGRFGTNFRFRRITPLDGNESWHVWVGARRGRRERPIAAGVRLSVVDIVGREASTGPELDERVGGERRSCLVSYKDFLLCITPLFDTRAFAVYDSAFARTTPGIGDDPTIVHVHNPRARKVTWPLLSSARGVAGIPLRGKPTHM